MSATIITRKQNAAYPDVIDFTAKIRFDHLSHTPISEQGDDLVADAFGVETEQVMIDTRFTHADGSCGSNWNDIDVNGGEVATFTGQVTITR